MLAICDIGFKLPKKSDLAVAAAVFFRIAAPLESIRSLSVTSVVPVSYTHLTLPTKCWV